MSLRADPVLFACPAFSFFFLIAAAASLAEESATGDGWPVPTSAQIAEFTGDSVLHGRLTWSDGTPAAGTIFNLMAYGPETRELRLRQVTSDAEGRYRVDGLKGGSRRYRLRLASDDTQQTYYIPIHKPGSRVEYDYKFQPRVGDPAPPHVMPDLAGRDVDLRSFLGKVVVLKFWAVWCGPCHHEMEAAGALIRKRPEWKDEVVFVAVNADPGRKEVTDFIREKKLEGMVHLFEEGKKWVSVRDRDFRINSLPFTFVLDREGIVRFRGAHAPDLEKVVSEILNAEEAPR